MTRPIVTRRSMVIGGATVLATPYLWSRSARAAGQVVVRNPGGAYDETQRRNVYDPFTKETGIEVVVVASTMAKMLAMVKAGSTELDVADAGLDGLATLDNAGALGDIDYGSWKHTDPKDIADFTRPRRQSASTPIRRCWVTTRRLSRRASSQKAGRGSWDAEKFPGPRMLADMASGTPNLEFALIADGVPMDKIFPIDIDRAFKSLSKIKPHIKKFWDTGALSAQMLADKEVVLGSIWNGRLQAVADKGAPVAIEWNQHMLQIQAYGVFKDAKNKKEAQLLIDFSLSPKAQLGSPRNWVMAGSTANRSTTAGRAGRQAARQPGTAET